MIHWVRRNWWWIAAAFLAAYKLSLLQSQHIYAIGNAHHDDALFMKLAGHIARGEWLGPYDQFTLAKGPAYSVFIAANFWTGLPLGLSQQLVYLLACVMTVWALAPALTAGWARLLAFAFLFYNPLTYEGETMTRILRQHLTVPMAMMVAAGLVAICLRGDRKPSEQAVWACLAGLAGGIFMITREEGVWILPMAVACWVGWLVRGWLKRESNWARRWLAAVVFLVAGMVPYVTVASLNARHYGWFGVVDFKSAAFENLIGALTRIEVGPERHQVQVNREAREAAYLVSPAFAEIRPFLEEGPIALKWMEKEKHAYEERQYMAGWFNWALRDAIAAAGYVESPVTFLAYCSRVADEINMACDDGRLPAAGPRSSLMPKWQTTYTEGIKNGWWDYLDQAMRLTRFETIVPESVGSDDEIRDFVDLSWDSISPAPRATYFHKPNQIESNRVKIDALRGLADTWRAKFEDLFWVSAALLLLRPIELIVRRRWSWLTWLGVAVFAAVVAQLALNLLVHVVAFDNFYPAAWAPAYPLMQLVVILMLTDAARHWVIPGARRGWENWKTRRTREAPAD